MNGSSRYTSDKTKTYVFDEAVYKDNKSVKSLTFSITYILSPYSGINTTDAIFKKNTVKIKLLRSLTKINEHKVSHKDDQILEK